MSKKNDDIGAKLAKLALDIADKAAEPNVLLVDKLEAFRHLTTYYVNTTKVAAKQNADDEEEGFDGFRKRISAAASGAGPGNSGDGNNGEDLFN